MTASGLDFGGALESQKDDKEKTQVGVWVTGEELGLGKNPDGSDTAYQVKSTYRTNVAYVQAQAEWRERHTKETGFMQLHEWQVGEMLRYAFAHGCLVNWRNVQDSKGREIKFDPTLIEEYRKLLPHLFDKLESRTDRDTKVQEKVADQILGE